MIFRNWVLQNFPFLEDDFDALTDYELFCKMMEYVKEFAKDNQEFKQRIEELEDYVYNLNIQDAVNNKLDEMAEDGTLEEIMAEYLNVKAVFGFDSVASMKSATNLLDGSYADTLGYYSKNDGGNASYKIREITNDDVVDEMFIIALSNENLVAELIYGDEINIKQLGAKGNGTFDNTAILNNAIDKCGKVYIPSGNYLTGAVELKSDRYIKGENIDNTILTKKDGSLYVLGVEDFNTLYNTYVVGNQVVPYNVGLYNVSINDLTINGNHTAGFGILAFGRYFNWNNIIVKDVTGDGIWTAFGQHGDPVSTDKTEHLLESQFNFIKILNTTGKGWVFNGPHDSYLNNCIIVGTGEWAFYENTPNGLGSIFATNCNCWGVANGYYLKSGGRLVNCIFSGADHTGTGYDTYGLYGDDAAGSISAVGCIWGGMDYGVSLKGANHYITGQFYQNVKANLDLRDCYDSMFDGVFTPSSDGTVISSTSTVGAITLFGNINASDISLTTLGVTGYTIYNALCLLKTFNGQIINFPNGNNFTAGGWSPSFPASNGTILTTDVAPTQSTRGGVLTQPYGYLTAGQAATTDQLNDLIATLVTAGVLTIS